MIDAIKNLIQQQSNGGQLTRQWAIGQSTVYPEVDDTVIFSSDLRPSFSCDNIVLHSIYYRNILRAREILCRHDDIVVLPGLAVVSLCPRRQ